MEFAAAHMVSKLMENATQALRKHHINNCFGWTDNNVALQWIEVEKEQHKQFINNRVAKVKNRKCISWQYVVIIENSTGVASRGFFGDKLPPNLLDRHG